MSRAPSILDQLSALDDIANDAAPPVASAPPPADPVYSLLMELKRDIDGLKREQAQERLPPPPPAMSAHDRQLYAALSELKHDIDALKREQSQQSLPPGERDLYRMLAELKHDIEVLNGSQDRGWGPAQSRQQQAWGPPGPAMNDAAPWYARVPVVPLWVVEIAFLGFVVFYVLQRH